MVTVVQLVYVVPGLETDFLAFESIVLPMIARYGGEILLRLRPSGAAFVEGTLESPYEVHVVRFPDKPALDAYGADPERTRVLHLKERSVRATLTVTETGL